jgi:AhpD family alkylhydroperoxidase
LSKTNQEAEMNDSSRTRIYTKVSSFFYDLFCLTYNSLAYVKNATQGAGVSHALREKLMVAVSGVLSCRYCTWLHSEMALTHGVNAEEVQKLLSMEIGDFPDDEAIALAFAQHYSETGGKPQEKARARLDDYYGRKKAGHIVSFVQMIYFGNLAGNTVDAFLNRLKGNPAEGSNLWSETVIFLLVSPYYLIILPVLAFTLSQFNSRKAGIT